MKRWFLVAAIIMITLSVEFGVVQAQTSPLTLDVIGHVGGAVAAVASDGDYLYVGLGLRIHVYDLANPEAPTKIAQTDILVSKVRMLEVVGDYVYAFLSSGDRIPNQFIIVDVSKPSAPERLGAIPMPSERYWGNADMHIAGDYAYITGESATRILDISNPADPQDIGVYSAGGPVTLLEENHLLVGKTILDVSDPEMPLYLGMLDAPGITDFFDAVVAGNLLYLSTTEGLVILDVADIMQPVLVGRWQTEMSVGVMTLAGNRLYVGEHSGMLRIFDVSDPQMPLELNTLALPDLGYDGLAVAGDYVYIGAQAEVLLIVDAADPSDLHVHQVSQGVHNPVDVYAGDGPYVYVIDESGISILDVTAPGDPQRVGNIAITPHDMKIQHPYVYIVDGSLRVFDVSDPQMPIEISTLALGGQTVRIQLIDDRAYINSAGLHIIDIGDPANPQDMAVWPVPAHDVSVDGEDVYVYFADGTFDIYKIAASSAPQLLVQAPLPREFWDDARIIDMRVSDGLAYILSPDQFWIFDVNEPGTPKLIRRYDNYHSYYGAIAVVGHKAYVLGTFGPLEVIDASNQQHPILVAEGNVPDLDWYDFYENSVGLAVHNDIAYIANKDSGLYLLGQQVSPPPPTPTPTPSPPSPLEFVDRQSGATRAVYAQNDYLYLGNGQYFSVVRIETDDEQYPEFTPVGKSELLPTIVTSVAARDRYAYVMAGSLLVFDVSDPAHPTIIARPATIAGKIHLTNQRLYLTSGSHLQTFDLSDPSTPSLIGDSSFPVVPQTVQLTAERAYALEEGSLAIYDLSDPQNPFFLGGMYAESAGLAAIGDMVYLLSNRMCALMAGVVHYIPDLDIIDTSDPTNPVRRGGMSAPWEGACGNRTDDIFAWDDRVYISQPGPSYRGGPGVGYAIDVSDPEHPQQVGEDDTGTRIDVLDVSATDDYLFVLYADEFMITLSTESFAHVGGYHSGGATETIHLDGHRLGATTARKYLNVVEDLTGYWMQLFDLGNADSLEPMGKIWLGFNVLDVMMKDQYSYSLHLRCCDDQTDLKITDISNPEEPQTLYEEWTHSKFRIWVADNTAYLLGPFGYDDEIQILNISDRTQPQELSVYKVDTRALEDFLLLGDYAYLLTNTDIRAIDLHDLEAPVETGSAEITVGYPTNIWHAGHFLYILTRRGHSPGSDYWLQRVDVSDPAHPGDASVYKLGRFEGDFTADMSEQFLYLAGQGRVHTWEIIPGAAPFEHGIYDTGGATNDVVAEGRYIYVADGDAGVLRLRNPFISTKLWFPLQWDSAGRD